MSVRCLGVAPDIFKMAISLAPVTDWRYYDSIYTERYMLTDKENKAGYDSTSVLPYAKNIKGKLLLVHGLADDNVHYQNSAMLINTLYKNNVMFEQMTFPNKNHGISGGNTRFYLYTKFADFIKTNL
jgi:dipeptidyl-peptidase-4